MKSEIGIILICLFKHSAKIFASSRISLNSLITFELLIILSFIIIKKKIHRTMIDQILQYTVPHLQNLILMFSITPAERIAMYYHTNSVAKV